MKYFNIVRHMHLLCLTLVCLWLPALSIAQATISGDNQVCLGEVVTYTPTPSDPSLVYTWTATGGTVLSGNYAGANIQWTNLSVGAVTLTVTNPSSPGGTPSTVSFPVTVNALPEPYITSDVLLGCQPLQEDTTKNDPRFDEEHCQLVCAHSTVTYTVHGSAGSSFIWNAPGAVSISSSGTTCTITWGDPGYGQVHVTETTAAGCEAESSFCVEIVERPTAMFSPQPIIDVDPITICLDGEVVLMDESTGSASSPIVNWHWDWGDGHETTTSPGGAASPVSHQYTTFGDFVITLTVTNACGCTSTYTRKVRVQQDKAPKIACPRVVCEKEKTSYTIDKPCEGNNWDIIGGHITYSSSSRVDVIWDAVDPNTGFGYIMYKTCAPCVMTVTEEVPVILSNPIIQGPVSVCLGEQYVYRLPKWPTTDFNWNIVSGPGIIEPTDQRNETALRVTGTGTIILHVGFRNTVLGCGGEATITINVNPKATISGDDLFCQGDTRTYNVGGAAADWILTDASGAVITTASTLAGTPFSYTFSTPGTYRLSATGSSFCPPEDFFIKVVGTPAPADAITGPARACPGIPVRYEAINPIAGTTYEWSTPSGSVDAPVGDYSYLTFSSLPATIQVVRVTTDEAHCTSTPITKTVLEPVPPFTISGEDEPCHSTEEDYTASYTEGDSYEWYLSDPDRGSVVGSDGPHATILWNVPDPMTGAFVTIYVKVMKCGMPHIESYDVFVKGTPEITAITLASDTVCSGAPVVINVTTTYEVNNTSTTGYTWQWGDGPGVFTAGFPTVATPPSTYQFSHIYYTDGMNSAVAFTPSITIKNPNGCTGTVTATAPTVTVMPRPVAWISPAGTITHCGTGWSETLTATVTTGIGGSNFFDWLVPPLATDPGNTPINPYANQYGTYSVVVTNDVFGCADTASTSISENCGPGSGCPAPPTIVLSPNPNFGDCGDIEVTATVTGPPAATGYTWLLSPGVSLATPAPTATTLHAKAEVAGVYPITYRVFYDPGCYFDKSINVTVPYVADLRSEISCNQAGGNYTITLYDHSTVYPAYSISSRQYYGPGGLISSGGLSATTTQAGGTTVTYYQVISGSGMAACTSAVTITTPYFPTTSITVTSELDMGCVKDYVFEFTHTSTPTSGLGFWWDFDDLTYNTNEGPTIGKVYNSALIWHPFIKVTDEYGCYATASTTIEVEENPYHGKLTTSGSPVCQGSLVNLYYNSTDFPATYPTDFVWYEQATPIATTSGAPYEITTGTPGGYWVEGIGNYGCKVKTDMVPVIINQIPTLAIAGNANQCVNQLFVLTTQNYGASYTYSWSGPGATGTGPSITLTHSTAGTYTYTVTITDVATGCQSTSPSFTVTVFTPPAPPVLSASVLTCQPYLLELTATGAAGTYNWSNGGLGPVITTPHGGPYQVTLTDLQGCRVESSFIAPVSPEEYLWVFPTGCFCKVQVQLPYLIGPIVPFDYWAWLNNGAVDVSGSGLVPNYYITPGRVYNLTLDNGWCQVTSGDMYYESDTCNRLGGGANPTSGKPGAAAGADDGPNSLQWNGSNALGVAPNPAFAQATVTFVFAPGSKQRTIELYDMTGRRLQSHTLAEESGSLTLKLDGYAAGLYQLVMKRDGVAVGQSKLSVTR